MSYLYLICTKTDNGQFKGPCKVGITSSLKSRLASIQTGSATQLAYYEIFGDGPQAHVAEARVHHLLRDKHIRGEWFDIDPEQARRMIECLFMFIVAKLGLMTPEEQMEMDRFGLLDRETLKAPPDVAW